MKIEKTTRILLFVAIHVFVLAWSYEFIWCSGYEKCREDMLERHSPKPVIVIRRMPDESEILPVNRRQ